jgi:hypothetical protein
VVFPDAVEVKACLLGQPDLLEHVAYRLRGGDRLAFRALPGRAEAIGAKLELHDSVPDCGAAIRSGRLPVG